jgi:hypothetical protein
VGGRKGGEEEEKVKVSRIEKINQEREEEKVIG